MRDLTVIVHDDYVDNVIDSLHEAGIAEISDITRDEIVSDLVEPNGIPDIVSKLTEYDMKLNSVIDVFDVLEEEKDAFKKFINPEVVKPRVREKKELGDLINEIDEAFDDKGDHILGLGKKLSDTKESIDELNTLKKNLQTLKNIDMNLSYLGESEYTIIKAGITSKPELFKEKISELDSSFYHIEKIDEDKYVIISAAYIKEENQFESILRKADVKPFEDIEGLKGKPTEALSNIKEKIQKYQKRENEILDELKSLKKSSEKKFLILKEELNIHREKKEIIQNFGNTESSNILKGWTPKSKIDEVKKVVDNNSEGCSAVITEEPQDPDETPTKLDNPKPLKPFELLTNMFAPPKYNEVDPTFILAPAFVLFFGLMLGDLVYGTIILVTSIVLIKGLGKVDTGSRNFGWVLFGCGFSTIIFGAIQGGYMGPARENYPNLLGFMGLGTPSILDTLKGQGPLTLLIISLIIGLTYINAGLLLSLVQHIHRGHYKNILLENLSWWTLEPGGFILISGGLFGWFNFSSTVNYVAWGLVGIGLVLLFLRSKGLSFFEITGFIGDFLSFARILALGLATAGIGLTVNVLVDLISKGSVGDMMVIGLIAVGAIISIYSLLKSNRKLLLLGILIGVFGGSGFINSGYPFYIIGMLIFIGGHIINLGLQALGSFVHSLRLQYVEFFGYFYGGGGSPFTPFKPKRIYTKLKNEVVK